MQRATSWVDQILDQIPSGVDGTQIEERLRMTPEERLEAMLAFMRALEPAEASHGGPDDTQSTPAIGGSA